MVEPALPPQSWEEYCKMFPVSYEESVITFQGSIAAIVSESVEACDRSVVFYTYNEAKAFLALAELRQLLRVWCEGQEWGEVKYSLYWDDEVEGVAISETGQGSLRFPSLKLAMGFCHCFKDLLSQAPPLL